MLQNILEFWRKLFWYKFIPILQTFYSKSLKNERSSLSFSIEHFQTKRNWNDDYKFFQLNQKLITICIIPFIICQKKNKKEKRKKITWSFKHKLVVKMKKKNKRYLVGKFWETYSGDSFALLIFSTWKNLSYSYGKRKKETHSTKFKLSHIETRTIFLHNLQVAGRK